MCGSFPGLLIGRTAVHSGKDPAFVAYDQFLSTGILQPLSRGEVRRGSDPALLRCLLDVRFAPEGGLKSDIVTRRLSVPLAAVSSRSNLASLTRSPRRRSFA